MIARDAAFRALLVALTALSASVLSGLPAGRTASADAFGWPDQPNGRADSKDHWYCWNSSVSGDESRIDDAMTVLDAQTDMYDVSTSGCGTSTDVVWGRNDSLEEDVDGDGQPEPLRGRTACASWSPSWGVCDMARVAYNRLEIYLEALHANQGASNEQIAENFDINLRKTLGHELGHTTGLVHNSGPSTATCSSPTAAGPADAMRSGQVTTNPVFNFYNDHHIGCHVNPAY